MAAPNPRPTPASVLRALGRRGVAVAVVVAAGAAAVVLLTLR